MPELPEVETVVRKLRPRIVGKKVVDLVITDRKVVSSGLLKYVPFTIKAITRRGKYIFLETNKQFMMMVHLRMTGHFHYLVRGVQEQGHLSQEYRAGLFRFQDGSAMTFNEIRRFGRVEPLTLPEYDELLHRLGPDPFDVSVRKFCELLQEYPTANIKTKLLDQSCIAGIGNIYAQEALYHAGINPLHKIGEVSLPKLKLLHHQLVRILRLAIQKNGTTVSNYRHLDGKGDFAGYLAVYQKEKCPKGHTMESVKIGGRGTTYCSVCQR
ncbi:DNA-formamidopyrimidine glycosylase [Candidatus Woesearchaeota archaeon]|nr:DNA-formamidopyrimidine glycosylase [Candidatus Woesearchaeota archaeon]